MKDDTVYYTHKGEDRPLIYITNYGDVTIKKGDKLKIYGYNVFIDGVFDYDFDHRPVAGISNLVSCVNLVTKPSTRDEMVDILINKVLKGLEKTPLEYQQAKIKTINDNLPKRSFYMAKYNFTNTYRPVDFVEYRDGIHVLKSGDDDAYSLPFNIGWYIYHNNYKILPEGSTECSAKEYDELPEPYEYKQ